MSNDCLIFNIIDVKRIRRHSISISTENKECSVLSCRINGKSSFYTQNGTFTASCGELLYIPKGATYKQKTDGEDVVVIHLDILGKASGDIQHIVCENGDEINEKFCEIEKIWRSKRENYKYYCTSLIYGLVAQTSIGLASVSGSTGILEKSLKYINEHFADRDFSIEKACRQSNISRAYFNRLFRTEIGTTPSLYISRLKIDNALFLLKSGNYTHEEIAKMCGFEDVKYFYTVFKKVTGHTTAFYKNCDMNVK